VVAGVATRAAAFPVAAALAAAVGVSTYAYLYVRSGLDPTLDMADPETWERLLAVIRREQYPPRSPLDNPIFPSGPGNPGRTPELFLQQLLNYVQYFDWQWPAPCRSGAGSPARQCSRRWGSRASVRWRRVTEPGRGWSARCGW
jgi:hypothetical protein